MNWYGRARIESFFPNAFYYLPLKNIQGSTKTLAVLFRTYRSRRSTLYYKYSYRNIRSEGSYKIRGLYLGRGNVRDRYTAEDVLPEDL